MTLQFPYTHVSCPCSEASRRILTSKRTSRDVAFDAELLEEAEDKPFDPKDPRSAFSLFPPEHLLYCEECHDIKCPRCVTEEIICWYCPQCLFEVTSSTARKELNRCDRNCFTCSTCTSQLSVTITDRTPGGIILICNYCMWSTLDINTRFYTMTNMKRELQKMAEQNSKQTAERKDQDIPIESNAVTDEAVLLPNEPSQPEGPPSRHNAGARYQALKAFYKNQMAASTANDPASLLSSTDSPSSLLRLMNMYSKDPLMKSNRLPKQSIMREARTVADGLQGPDDANFDVEEDYSFTVTPEQRRAQHPNQFGEPNARHVSELKPLATLLRTKRSKRCAACKHILVKPESKPTSTRFRIRLLANSYIPSVSTQPVPLPDGIQRFGPDGADVVLQPGKPTQWIMTLRNPLFEQVSVSLGTPSITPGKHGHRITILCPQFTIGKNGDVWDDAINPDAAKTVTNATVGDQIAGRLYDQGRNWVSVVIEIVPASIIREQDRELEEDEDVVEVPIRVRLEWKVTEDTGTMKTKAEKLTSDEGVEDDGSREVSYWMVLGFGRVAC